MLILSILSIIKASTAIYFDNENLSVDKKQHQTKQEMQNLLEKLKPHTHQELLSNPQIVPS